jgi:hypothetical protein
MHGVRHLDANDSPPPHFNEAALHYTAALIRSFAKGVTGIEFSSNGDRAFATKAVAANAQIAARRMELIRAKQSGQYEEYGSIEGHLKELSEQSGRDRLVIVDALTGKPTRCYIRKRELEKQAGCAWKQRVAVTGNILTDRFTGEAVRVEVDEIRILRDQSSLPQIDDLFGIDITGGVEPADYIRGLRDAE